MTKTTGAKLQAARTELIYGLLWMLDTDCEELNRARQAIYESFGADKHERSKRGIEAALSLGFEADHPSGADYCAGMNDSAPPKNLVHCDEDDGK